MFVDGQFERFDSQLATLLTALLGYSYDTHYTNQPVGVV